MAETAKTIKTGVEISDKPTEYDFSGWLLQQLMKAYFEARKGKRRTRDQYAFEVNWFKNLVQLRDDILRRAYKPSRGIAFVTLKPVIREIFAAPFRDRVIHHFLYAMCAKWMDAQMIYDSYSCRVGKGVLFGIRRLEHMIRSVSVNYQIKVYVIKMDIQGYFMSLPRVRLLEMMEECLDKQFADNPPLRDLLYYLWREVIMDDPTKGVKKRGPLSRWRRLPDSKSLFKQFPGLGIVIGNLTSQLLSNMYLNKLDRYIKYELGYKNYGRYVDDFFIVVTEDELARAKKDIEKIRAFLKGMGLTLHPKKTKIQDVNKGVDFLGVVIYPHRTVMGKRFKKNFYEAAHDFAAGRRDEASIVSYLGYAKHHKARKLCKRVLESAGW